MCTEDRCVKPVVARGLCRKHYQRWWKNGDPGTTLRRYFDRSLSLEDRLRLDYAVDSNECWVWTGTTTRGYGTVNWKGFDGYAHRAAYLVWVGEIPEGLLVRHKCDNRPCINPAHLELGTHEDNMEDAVSRGRTNKGSSNPQAKLNEEIVLEMRRQYSEGVSQAEIGRAFGVSQTVAGRAINGKTWRHV